MNGAVAASIFPIILRIFSYRHYFTAERYCLDKKAEEMPIGGVEIYREIQCGIGKWLIWNRLTAFNAVSCRPNGILKFLYIL
jgi:hypothetical protein